MTDPWEFQRWAFEQRAGGVGRKAILTALAMMADANTGRCEVKQRTLSEMCEIKQATVVDHLRALVESGLIVRRAQFRVDGGRRCDEFLLRAPWVTEWPDGAPLDFSGRGENSYPPSGISKGGSRTTAWNRNKTSSKEELVLLELPRLNQDISAVERIVRFDGKTVPRQRLELAEAILGEFNRQAGTGYGAYTGRGHPSEDLKRIIGALTDARPPVTFDEAKRIIAWALKNPFWEGRPSAGVVFGPKVFPATRESAASRVVRRNGNGRGNGNGNGHVDDHRAAERAYLALRDA